MAMKAYELAGQHENLGLDLDRLHVLAVANVDVLPEVRMRALLVRELKDLVAELDYHFGCEEEGGYLGSVLDRRPNLDRNVERLQGQHREILERLERLAVAAESEPTARTKHEIVEILDLIGDHERGEEGLLQRTFTEDLGEGD